jgi:hypothetical protein
MSKKTHYRITTNGLTYRVEQLRRPMWLFRRKPTWTPIRFVDIEGCVMSEFPDKAMAQKCIDQAIAEEEAKRQGFQPL